MFLCQECLSLTDLLEVDVGIIHYFNVTSGFNLHISHKVTVLDLEHSLSNSLQYITAEQSDVQNMVQDLRSAKLILHMFNSY